MSMNGKVEKFQLGKYAFNVECEDNHLAYFSVTEVPELNKSRILMWRRGLGFKARIVIYDSRSNYERVKPLEPGVFPDADVLRLLRESPEMFQHIPRIQLIGMDPEVLPQDVIAQLKMQLVEIFENRDRATTELKT